MEPKEDNMMEDLINKRFTLAELAEVSGASSELLKRWRRNYNDIRSLSPETLSSGRTNYIYIQNLICQLSNGQFKPGGQGKGRPDFYYLDEWCETKGYQLGTKKDIWVSASSFFANNCKAVPHKVMLKEGKDAEAKRYLFEHSFNKNKFYLLTSTTAMACKFDEIEMMFVETSILKSCLLESKNYTEASRSELAVKVVRYEQR